MREQTPCPECDGMRWAEGPGGVLQPCPGCDGTGQDRGVESFFVYVFDVTLALAATRLDNQRVVMDGDAAFRLKALGGTQTGDYRIRLRDGSGHYLSTGGAGSTNDLVRNGALIGTAQFPFPIIPHVIYAPSGHILIDLENQSGAPANIVQIAFIGAKVTPTPAPLDNDKLVR